MGKLPVAVSITDTDEGFNQIPKPWHVAPRNLGARYGSPVGRGAWRHVIFALATRHNSYIDNRCRTAQSGM